MGAALPNLGVPTDPALYDAALEGHTRVNEELLRRKVLPPVYTSGVTYQPTTSKRWKFADEIVSTGVADCEGLSCWRAAELRVSGEDPGARARTYRTGKNKFHAVVERSEGYMEDPSVLTGMPVRDGRGYIAKLVDNFGEIAVSGDDGDYTNVDDFYNSPPPFGFEGAPGMPGYGGGLDLSDPIDSFYAMGPSPGDMGPGVGPAESSWGSDPYGGGGDGGGGGGGGGGGPDPSQQQQGRRPFGGMFGGRGFGGFGGGGFGQQPSYYGGGYPSPPSYQQATTYGPAPMPSPPSMSTSPAAAAFGGARQGAFAFGGGASSRPSGGGFAKSAGSRLGGRWKGTRGVAGVLDVPVVYLEGDDVDDYRSPEFGPDDDADPDQRGGASASAYDDRDITVDVQPADDGYVSTVRVPLSTGKTVVAQTSKAKTAKAAAAKAANIAATIANDKDVQSLLPPSAKVTLKVLKSSTAKKVFHALGF